MLAAESSPSPIVAVLTSPDVIAAGTALLVAHGTVLRLWTALAAAPGGGADPAWIADHPMRNAGISLVEGDPEESWRLVDWNEGEWNSTHSTGRPSSV